MKLLIPDSELDTALRRGGWFLLIGFPALVAAVATRHGLVIAATMGTAYGAACGSFGQWRRERGLWMPAILFLLMFMPIYAAFVCAELFGSHSELSAAEVLDFCIATWVLGRLCRLLISVAVHNWRLTHGRGNDAYTDSRSI